MYIYIYIALHWTVQHLALTKLQDDSQESHTHASKGTLVDCAITILLLILKASFSLLSWYLRQGHNNSCLSNSLALLTKLWPTVESSKKYVNYILDTSSKFSLCFARLCLQAASVCLHMLATKQCRGQLKPIFHRKNSGLPCEASPEANIFSEHNNGE